MSAELSIEQFDPMEIIVNSTGAMVYVIDLMTYEVLYANDRCIEEFGEIIGTTCFKSLQKNQDSPCYFCPLQQSGNPLSHPVGTTFEWENQNSINNRHYLFNDRIIQWKNGQLAKVQVGIDITKQKLLEQEILNERDESIRAFEALSDSTIEGLIIYDESKRCIHVNKVAPQLFGYSSDEMIGRYALDFIAPESKKLVASVIQNDDQEPYEAQMLRKDGSLFPAILRGRNFVLSGKNIRVSAVMDISDIKQKEEEILKLAHYDILTALPNQLLLRKYLQKNNKNDHYGALLFIDLDHFKTINDTKGHSAGDLVLIETAKRITETIRQNDTVSRSGGDEFVVLIDTCETDKERATDHISALAKKILSELQKPYLIMEYDFRLSASIGIALFLNNEHSIDDLYKYADSAMYNAKANGRNTFNFFDPKLQQMMESKALLIERLRKAVEDQSMTLFYQPQIILINEHLRFVGVEALIRWNDPKDGMISPGKFIPIAEESGLIIPLGKWVLQEAIRQLKQWESDEDKKEWRISVNVSYKQFEKDDFITIIESLIHEYDICPEKLRLELTESLLVKNMQEALNKINHLKALGLSLSIDDFGTGYSSLSYLKQLPIDELKIDQSFIRDLTNDPNDVIIVETILSIAQKFGLDVIAEGVETEEQYEQLVSMGCKHFQGYLFGRPVEPSYL
ncbi:MAG: diguanylate cyclase [Sulfurimonas sp. RIFOXYD12_FULL_36_11]|nr:MAG: diguanylate cyclase [Sulfurimonas sp. RIFOXYD12_FULL_36_11]